MVGKKRTPEPPPWYILGAYAGAHELDAGDWLLNLALRSWLNRDPKMRTEEALRSVGPLLRRNDAAQIIRMHRADEHRWVDSFSSSEWDDAFDAFDEAKKRPSLPSDVWHALGTGTVGSGIEPLTLSGLYVFEKRLPEKVRAAGAHLQRDEPGARSSPHLAGTLDDAFAPQMVSRFARINLSLPDDVLRADLNKYLASERHRLAATGGKQPYREAARLKLKAHELSTLAKVGLLQFLDLDRWQRANGLGLSLYAVREMAGVAERARETELRRRVELVLHQFQLHAWFARLDRGGSPTRSRRSST